MDQENTNRPGGERKRPPIRYDENGRPIRPKRRPIQYDENGKPIPPKKRPVRYDENGRPIQPKRRPIQYDENGKPIPPKKRPVRYDENGRPIRPRQTAEGIEHKKSNGYEKYEQMEGQFFDRHAYAQEKANEAKARRENKKTKKKKRNRFGIFMTILQAVVSVVFFVLLNLLGMLPFRYLLVIGIILVVLWGFTFLSQRTKNGRVVGKVYAVIVTLILCLGSTYIWKAYDVMGRLTTGQTTKLSDVSVIVMEESPAKSLEDVKNKRFGVQKIIDKENTEQTLKELQSRLGVDVKTIEYESLKSQVQALYSGKVEVIIINEVYRSLIKEDFPEFDTQTRVLDAFTYTKEVAETSKADIKVDKEPFNVYLSGNDAWGEVSLANGRTDVNIIATVNPSTKQILLTTTPRDYYVELPFYDGCMDKLTHAGLYGIETSMETLENLYDIKIDYYVRINFSGFQNIIDALGGVNVYSEYAFQSVDGKEFDKGYNYLYGYDALLFVRERYAFANGDLQRGRNQMAMIKAMTEKLFSPAILTNYMGLMDSLSSCFITDMPRNKIADLVKMQLNDGAEWNIVSNSVLGYGNSRSTYSGGSERLSVLDPDEDDLQQAKSLILSCMNGDIISAPKKEYSIKTSVNYGEDEYDSYESESDDIDYSDYNSYEEESSYEESDDSTYEESSIDYVDSEVTDSNYESSIPMDSSEIIEPPVDSVPEGGDSSGDMNSNDSVLVP